MAQHEIEMDLSIVGEDLRILHGELSYFMVDYTKKLQALEKKQMDLENQLNEEMQKSMYESYSVHEILGPWRYEAKFDPMGSDEPFPALVYHNDLYIEIHKESYYLLIETEDWESQCLSELEEYLAEFSNDAGCEPWIESQ